jgi:aldehyde dehydrogenase (NAD+)
MAVVQEKQLLCSEWLKKPKKLLIDGAWVDAESGKTFETYNPATEEVLAKVAEGSKADVDKAVKAARKAFEHGPWRKMAAHERARLLYKLADAIEAHADELAQIETLDNGKPIKESRWVDVMQTIETFRYYAGWCTAPRAGRRSWSNHSVELPDVDGSVEAGPCSGLRQHRNPEAG